MKISEHTGGSPPTAAPNNGVRLTADTTGPPLHKYSCKMNKRVNLCGLC
jgi:hypothetical protein